MPSTVISGFDYNIEKRILEIRFISGAVYNYHKVPAKVYQGLKEAKSKGIYFNRFIKDNYPFGRKV